ncbi:sialate O-acetylesterase [Mariniflexile sp.]|uniref:sialate O-acetylesterase n=1 Tax=Mariniflexile sp. TaxID=1979402 RepID=UPI0040473BCF
MKKNLHLIAVVVCSLLYFSPVFAGNIETYPLASCYTASTYYTVKANGVDVPVAEYRPHGDLQYYFAHLSASDSNTFEVDGGEAITSYSIGPNAYGISGTVNSTKLQFTVNESRYLQIQINSKTILYLLIDPIEETIPNASGVGIYNITQAPYNADNTGATDVTFYFQQAINNAAANGGGTVYVPEGVYLVRTIYLKSNVNLYLKGGAALLAKNSKFEFPNSSLPNHILRVDNATNVKVYGRGSIYSRGNLLNGNVRTDSDGEFRIGPAQISNSTNTTFEGILCVESTAWSLTFVEGSSNGLVKNVKILNEMTWAWNDGINVIGSNNITVQHCFISTADDTAAIKTQNFPKVQPGDPVYNVIYDDIVMKSGISSGFKVGMQAEDDIYDVWAKNINVLDCERAFNLDHWYGDGNFYNIHFVDWVVDKMTGTSTSITKGKYVDSPFRMEITQQPSTSYEVGVGKISNIEITRVKFNDFGANDSYFWGQDATNNIDGVTITDLYFGNTLVLNAAAGHIQNKGFATNITYNGSSSVVTLDKIEVDGVAISYFDNAATTSFYLPYTYNVLPVVSVTPTAVGATYSITQATNLSGTLAERTATIEVTSQDTATIMTYKVEFEKLPELDLFLSIGQSNMAGRATIKPLLGDLDPVENAYLMADAGQFIDAVNPFNLYSSTRKEVGLQQIGPSFSFSKKIAAAISNQIGFVVNARGDTDMDEWDEKTDNLYAQAILRAIEAQKWGTFKAVLWHQGEANITPTEVSEYPQQLANLVANLRDDLGNPNLFFVAGQLGQFKAGHADFNEMLKTIPTSITNSAWVSSLGLTDKGDGLHFDRNSQIIFGERYADRVLNAIYGGVASNPIVGFTQPLANAKVPVGSDLTVIVDAMDIDGSIASVALYLNNVLLDTKVSAPYEWSDYPQLKNLAAGPYTLKAVAADNDTFQSETTIAFSVSSNQTPIVSFAAPTPTEGAQLSVNSVSVKVNASDPDGSISKIELYMDDNFVRNEGVAPYLWGENSQDPLLMNLSAGNHTLKAIAFDNDGDTAEVSVTFNVLNDPLSVDSKEKLKSISIYPNPVSGKNFYMDVKGNSVSEISIFSITGKLVYKKLINRNNNTSLITLDTPSQSGFYIVQIVGANDGVYMGKLVVK